jgi:Na+-driven multidrug efflux pump
MHSRLGGCSPNRLKHDPAVVALGAACLRIVGYGNLGYAYFMVMMQAFNGAGNTITLTIANFFGFWLFEIPSHNAPANASATTGITW